MCRVFATNGHKLAIVTEQQPYRVIEVFKGFELRHYPQYVLVSVTTKGPFNAAASRAFYPLVSFIGGQNRSGEKIAMTAPVLHKPINDETHTISFVMPETMDASRIPAPTDAQVSTQIIDAHYAAATKFRGLANEEHFKSFGDQLVADVKLAGLKMVGDVYYARFDPPWKPGFLRRNEALVDVIKYPDKKGNK
jgi:SOUL heme-binding protein